MKKSKLAHSLARNPGSILRLVRTSYDNSMVFLTGKSPKRGPLFVVWNITDECNLKCPFCGWWRKGEIARNDDKTSQKIKIIGNLSRAGVWFISFCGGEPLLCNDLGRLVGAAKSGGMVVNVSTNGLLLEEKAGMLINAGIDFITISIDGHEPDIHDKMRRHEGLFRRIEAGIAAIRTLSRERPIFIEARYLINKKNYRGVGSFVKSFGDRVDSIVFKPIYKNVNVNYDVPEDMGFDSTDEESFMKCFNALRQTAYHRRIPDFFFNPEKLYGRFMCFAGTFFGGIDSVGRLYACQEMTISPYEAIGDLNDSGLMGLWQRPALKELRTTFKYGKRCNCWMDRFCLNVPLQKLLRPGYDKAKTPKVL